MKAWSKVSCRREKQLSSVVEQYCCGNWLSDPLQSVQTASDVSVSLCHFSSNRPDRRHRTALDHLVGKQSSYDCSRFGHHQHLSNRRERDRRLLSIDRNWLDLMKLHGATRLQTLLKLRIPAAISHLIIGMRISCGLAVIGAIVGEFFVGNATTYDGLGTLMTQWQARQKLMR